MKSKKKLLAAPYLVWMIAFTVIPLILIAVFGLTDRNGALTFQNVLSIAQEEHLKALLLSLLLSVACTAICLLVGYPLALILRNSGTGKAGVIIYIFILPMWMNSLLRIYAWLNLLDDGGLVYNFLRMLGFQGNIIGTNGAVLLGMVYDFLPFMILPLYTSLTAIDDQVLNAARDLGANERKVLTRVIFPLSFPGVVSGITMVFVPSLTTFVISDLLGGRKITLIGNVIESEFSIASNPHVGSGLSLVLMVFILASMAVLNHYDRSGEEEAA